MGKRSKEKKSRAACRMEAGVEKVKKAVLADIEESDRARQLVIEQGREIARMQEQEKHLRDENDFLKEGLDLLALAFLLENGGEVKKSLTDVVLMADLDSPLIPLGHIVEAFLRAEKRRQSAHG